MLNGKLNSVCSSSKKKKKGFFFLFTFIYGGCVCVPTSERGQLSGIYSLFLPRVPGIKFMFSGLAAAAFTH